MNHVHILLSNYTIISYISYSIKQAINALSLDLTLPPEEEVYTTDIAALVIINKFIIKYGYKVIE